MPNTPRGYFTSNLALNFQLSFDKMASMVAAGSAIGFALEPNGSQGLASAAFPRAASLNLGIPAASGGALYPWDTILFRAEATSLRWLPDAYGSAPANGSMGIPMFGTDPRSIAFPAQPGMFTSFSVAAGIIQMIFLQHGDLDL